jgi:hypothetical protein
MIALVKLPFFYGLPFLARLKKSGISLLLSGKASFSDDGGRFRGDMVLDYLLCLRNKYRASESFRFGWGGVGCWFYDRMARAQETTFALVSLFRRNNIRSRFTLSLSSSSFSLLREV